EQKRKAWVGHLSERRPEWRQSPEALQRVLKEEAPVVALLKTTSRPPQHAPVVAFVPRRVQRPLVARPGSVRAVRMCGRASRSRRATTRARPTRGSPAREPDPPPHVARRSA